MILGSFPDLGRIKSTGDKDWISPEILRSNAAKRASEFLDKGIGPGKIIFIRHGETADFVADLLGVWSVGACAACLNPGLTKNELDNLVKFIEPAAILEAGKGIL